MVDVVIYSSDYCPYCMRAKQLLNNKGVAFNEIKVDAETAEWARVALQRMLDIV